MLSLGCWYFLFQTASIEIYEVRLVLSFGVRLGVHLRPPNTNAKPWSRCPQLNRISSLYLKDDVIIGELEERRCCGRARFVIDLPSSGQTTTKDLVRLCSSRTQL